MSKKFVRNITGTNLGGSKNNKNSKKVEPLDTNIQNDLLSDEKDVFVRNGDEYHCLTDNIKTVQGTSTVSVSLIDDNTVKLNPQIASESDTIEGENNNKIMTPQRVKQAVKEHETETILTSNDESVVIEKNGKNRYDLSIESSGDIDIVSEKGNLTVTREGNVFTVDMKTIIPGNIEGTISPPQVEFWGFQKISGGFLSNVGTQGNQSTPEFLSIESMKEVMTVLFNKITALQDEIDTLKNE